MTARFESLRARFRKRRHSALLGATIVSFAIRPLVGDTGAAPALFSIALLVLLLIALYNIQVDEMIGDREVLLSERRRRAQVGTLLAIIAFAERVAVLVTPSPQLFLLSSVCWLGFLAYVAWTEMRSMLRQREVTGETIAMCVTVYLLLGICWAVFYTILFQLDRNAFNFGGSTPVAGPAGDQHLIPILLYFSLTTLATIGYGDITPVTLQARYAAVAQGITGQFYLAILVARLVGLQMTAAERKRERAS